MHTYLLLTDFDQTVADTFSSHMGADRRPIYGTPDVVSAVVDRLFGPDTYKEIGGMQNRSPIELTRALSQTPQWMEGCRNLQIADEDPDVYMHVTKQLNNQKLHVLLEQIGRPLRDAHVVWPPHLPGFITFVSRVNDYNASANEARIDWGVISSGHDDFINTTFEKWSEHYDTDINPTVIVTQDTLEQRYETVFPTSESRRSKPNPMPLALGIMDWQRTNGNIDMRGKVLPGTAKRTKDAMDRVMYTGDDPVRDGHMARNADVVFGLMKTKMKFTAIPGEKQFNFGDWNDLATALMSPHVALHEGKPLDEILLGSSITHPESVYAQRHGERI